MRLLTTLTIDRAPRVVRRQMSMVRKSFHALLQAKGAGVALTVTRTTTHLITTEAEAGNPTSKVRMGAGLLCNPAWYLL